MNWVQGSERWPGSGPVFLPSVDARPHDHRLGIAVALSDPGRDAQFARSLPGSYDLRLSKLYESADSKSGTPSRYQANRERSLFPP